MNIYIKYLFCLIGLLFFEHLPAQIRHTVNFDIKNIEIKDLIGEDNTKYQKLKYNDLLNEGKAGYPELPTKYIHLSVPSNSTNFSITINSTQKSEILLLNKIYPAQKQIPTNGSNPIKNFSLPVDSIYQLPIYPNSIVSIVGDGFLDGDKHILTLKVSPVQYNPKENKLVIYNNISFSITDSKLGTRSTISKSINSIKGSNKTEVLELIQQLVDNPESVPNNIPNSKNSIRSTSTSTLPYYEYCIVTSKELAKSFERLASWKRLKGLNAGIICIEDILSDSSIKGDLVSNLLDNAGKLRGYLALAYSNGTKYVLLGGNDKVLPVRYGSGDTNSWGGVNGNVDAKIPSDLYFSDLNGNWNADNDKYLGEPYGDMVDFFPELYVGRLLCKTSEEVNNYTTKILKYEKNPGNGDYSYLKKAFYSQSDQMQRDKQANILAEASRIIHNQYTIYEEQPSYDAAITTFPKGKDAIDEMNRNYYSFVSFFGHGNPGGIAVSSNGIAGGNLRGVVALEGYDWYHVSEKGNGLNNLKNYNYPMIGYSIACDANPFDQDGQYNTVYNFGESFTVGGLYGGAAFLGNSRVGWVYSSYRLQQEFMKRIISGDYKLGVAEANSKAFNTIDKHWLGLTHHLIGCPEFEIWTNIPTKFTNATCTNSSSNVSVNNGGVNGTKTSIIGLFSGNTYIKQSILNSSSFSGVPKNYAVSISKHDYIPYIAPLFIQNETITGRHYIHGDEISVGNNVDISRTSGQVILKSGSEVSLESTKTVTLDPGFEVELGAIFEVIQ